MKHPMKTPLTCVPSFFHAPSNTHTHTHTHIGGLLETSGVAAPEAEREDGDKRVFAERVNRFTAEEAAQKEDRGERADALDSTYDSGPGG